MKKINILLIIIAFTMPACHDDYLTIFPETNLSSATFFQTESDFEQAVNGAYEPLRDIFNDRAGY